MFAGKDKKKAVAQAQANANYFGVPFYVGTDTNGNYRVERAPWGGGWSGVAKSEKIEPKKGNNPMHKRRSKRRNTGTIGKSNLWSLASLGGTFVGSSRRRRKSRRSKGGRCTTSKQCRSGYGTFGTCGKGVKRWAVTHCRNRKGQFVRKSRR